MRHPNQFQGCIYLLEDQILNFQYGPSRTPSCTSGCPLVPSQGQVSSRHSPPSEGVEQPLDADDVLEPDETLEPDEPLDAEVALWPELEDPPEPPLARATLRVVNEGAAYAPSASAPIRPTTLRRDKIFCAMLISLVFDKPCRQLVVRCVCGEIAAYTILLSLKFGE